MPEQQSRLSRVFGFKAGGGAPQEQREQKEQKEQKSLLAQPWPVKKQSAQAAPAQAARAAAKPAAAPAGGGVKQITIQMPTISIRIDEQFKAKLPFLLLCLLLFAFSLVLFEKSNFHTIDLVDLGRLQYNVSKLWSVSFVLFLLLYSFALALAMFYGFGQNWSSFLLVLVPTLVIAGVASLFYSGGYLLAFLAFALTLSAGTLLATFRTQVKFSSVYSTAGSAVLVLVVLSFFVSFNQISANKDAYIDAFISSGVTASVSQLQGEASLGTLVTPDIVRNAKTSGMITKDQIKAVIPKERVAKWFEDNPDFAKVSSAIKDSTINAVYAKLVDDLYSQAQNDLPALLANVRLSSGAAQTPVASNVKQVLGNTPAFVVFYDNFSLLFSMLIASIVAVFTFAMKLIATLLCWFLAKL
jgi:hypothetical protein